MAKGGLLRGFICFVVLTLHVVSGYGVEVQLTESEQRLKNASKLRQEKKFSESASEFSMVIKSSPGTANALKAQSNIAMIKIEQKDLAQAKAQTARMLSDYSSIPEEIDDALNLIAREYQRAGYQQETIDNCKYMIKYWPNCSRAMWGHSRQAQAYIELGDDVEAEKLIAAIKTKFADEKYFFGVLCNDIAGTYIAKGHADKAIKLYDDVLKIKADDPVVNVMLIKKHLDSQNYVLADQLTINFLAKFSSDADYGKFLFDIASQYRRSGKDDEVFDLYKYIIKNGPLDEFSMRAQAEITTRRVDKREFGNAAKELNVLKDRYGSIDGIDKCLKKVAYAYFDKKKYSDSIDLYKHSMKTSSDDKVGPYGYIAASNAMLGNDVEAEEYVKRIVIEYSDHKDSAKKVFDTAHAYCTLRKYNKASALHKITIDNWAENDSALSSMILDAAILDVATVSEPNHVSTEAVSADAKLGSLRDKYKSNYLLGDAVYKVAELYFGWANMQESKGNSAQANIYYQKAADKWQEIIDDFPKVSVKEAHLSIGDCYMRLKQPGKSLEYYNNLLTEWPDWDKKWAVQLSVVSCMKSLKRLDEISEVDADVIIRAAYENITSGDPNTPAAGVAQDWLIKHNN